MGGRKAAFFLFPVTGEESFQVVEILGEREADALVVGDIGIGGGEHIVVVGHVEGLDAKRAVAGDRWSERCCSC